MSPEYSRTRRYGRLTFRELVSGGVTATHDIHVLDLSLGGARIEHTVILRPGNSSYLRLPLKQQLVTVIGRVVWSRAVGRAAGKPGGTTGLLYQSGLEFGTLAQEAHALLTAFLEAEGTPPANRHSVGWLAARKRGLSSLFLVGWADRCREIFQASDVFLPRGFSIVSFT